MIITKKVSVVLNSANISYFENLGYHIPKIKKYGKMITPRKTKIDVLVKDLSKGSNTKIKCQCEKCHYERTIRFCDYTPLCQRCNHHDYKGGLPHCKVCGKQLSTYTSTHCISCKSYRLMGSNNPNYNPNLTEDERQNNRNNISPWRRKVKQRDEYICQCCGSTKNPQAHHIDCYSLFKEQRLDVDNGITLCKKCHKKIHQIFGIKTTRKHLHLFLKMCQFAFQII